MIRSQDCGILELRTNDALARYKIIFKTIVKRDNQESLVSKISYTALEIYPMSFPTLHEVAQFLALMEPQSQIERRSEASIVAF